MSKPLIRIPYTHPLPPPPIIPPSAKTLSGAISALQKFLRSPSPSTRNGPIFNSPSMVVLTGAGLSVASGLADYRGVKGTYRINKTYRPIYYHEYVASHEARKRYWARSFLGWTTLAKSQPNAAHFALRDLGEMGFISSVITQNVDSFHPRAHPGIPTLELHGYLRATVCTSCRNEFPREKFQEELARLNPAWAEFLKMALDSGALETEDPQEKRARGMKMNPDGDVDVPGAPYSTFRYPACPTCLAKPPPIGNDGTSKGVVEVDPEGAWRPNSNAGILKPNVIMFGESIPGTVKVAAEEVIDGAKGLLVLGTSLATYSAWRLVKRAKERGMPIAVINAGGVRGEDVFFSGLDPIQTGDQAVRTEVSTESLLPALVDSLRKSGTAGARVSGINAGVSAALGVAAFGESISANINVK